MIRRLRSLPRDVWMIGLISLVNDGASDLIYPLLPLYLTSVLLAGPKALGVIEGIAEASSSLLKLASGALSDDSGRTRPWIVTGYGMAGLSRPLIALASSWPVLLMLRFSDRIGKGLRSSPRDALLASVVTADQRGLAFGLHRAMDNAGAVIGPLVAAALLAWQLPLRQIITWSLLPGIVCTLLAMALHDIRPVSRPSASPSKVTSVCWQFMDLPVTLQRVLPVVALFTLANSSNLFLLLRARDLGVPQPQIPLLWAAISAVAMVGSAPLAAWSDRIGRRRLLVAGYGGYGMIYLLIAHLHSHGLWLWLLMVSYGLVLSATEGVEKALVADLSLPGQRGTAFGWFNLITGLAVLPSSLVFGWLYERFSPELAFTTGGLCALVAAAWLSRLSWKVHQQDQKRSLRRQRPSYGIDAPGLVKTFFVTGLVALTIALVAEGSRWPGGATSLALSALGGLVSVYALSMGCYMLYGSLVGKVRTRDDILGLLPWSGSEAVLDVGCGRGLFLTAAARRIPYGRAVGIDLWRAEDQSGNRPEATLANALAEGVAERVDIVTGDARQLPFADDAFDVVISHWVVHNLDRPTDRARALAEMARVLKPGGWLLIADIEHHKEYCQWLNDSGFISVRHVVSGFWDNIRGLISLGSFRPGTVVGQARRLSPQPQPST